MILPFTRPYSQQESVFGETSRRTDPKYSDTARPKANTQGLCFESRPRPPTHLGNYSAATQLYKSVHNSHEKQTSRTLDWRRRLLTTPLVRVRSLFGEVARSTSLLTELTKSS